MPSRWETHFRRGLELFQKGIQPYCTEELAKSVVENPTNPECHLYFAKSLVELGRHRRAIEEFEVCLKLSPSPRYFCEYGKALAIMGRYSVSVEMMDKAIELDPQNSDYHFFKYLVLLTSKKLSDALAEVELALKLKEDPESRLARAELLIELGRIDEGEEEYNKVKGLADTSSDKSPQRYLVYSKKIQRNEREEFWTDWED